MVYVSIPHRAWERLWGEPLHPLHRLADVQPVKGRGWAIEAAPGSKIPEGLYEALRALGYKPRRKRRR
jgi:hypothetical protein